MDDVDDQATQTLEMNTHRSFSRAATIDFNQPDALVGELLDGRFLIEKNLAHAGADAGGIGLVYLANDMKLMGKAVVVKILQESALKHKDIVRKFQHEKEALIRLDHPGIVRILDSGTLTDGNPFMVMEFIEGCSLRKVLDNTPRLPLDEAAHLIGAIMEALAAAHSKNILHRDIKPENIMITPQEEGYDRVRLIDFGIARVGESQLAPATETSRSIGTIRYIPPEQLIGSLDLTPAADIYSVAIVAYEMLTGELPFKPRAIAEMYKLEQEGVKTPPRLLRTDLPEAADKMLLWALRFEPETRPQDARVFGRDLSRALRGEAVNGSRNPIKTLLGVLIGILAVAAILLWGSVYMIVGPAVEPPDSNITSIIASTPESNTANTNVNIPIVKCPESSLPMTFDRSYVGTVRPRGQTLPLTIQLIRNNMILTGVAKTESKKTFVSDELRGTINPDGSFDVSSTPIGKEGTGKWEGRINLDCTVTGTWINTRGGAKPSRFSVTLAKN